MNETIYKSPNILDYRLQTQQFKEVKSTYIISLLSNFLDSSFKQVFGLILATYSCLIIFTIWQFLNINLNVLNYVGSLPLDNLTIVKPLPKYAIIIDAGSSGSRIFAYVHNDLKHGAIDKLLIDLAKDSQNNETLVFKISPGLSSFADNANASAEYLFELIDMVIDKIPINVLHGTPLYIMATAGMRLINAEQQNAILQDCRHDISLKYPFLHFPPSHIQIISGKMEGIYAWIALNYILGKFGTNEETVGIIDMGGASLQIAFQIPNDYSPNSLNQFVNSSEKFKNVLSLLNESLFDFDLSSNTHYKLYVKTFLGLGANEIIDKYQHNLVSKHSFTFSKYKGLQTLQNTSNSEPSKNMLGNIIEDPCFPVGYQYNITDEEIDTPEGMEIRFRGTGNFETCHTDQLSPFLNLSQTCNIDPCTLQGAHFPKFNIPHKFYGISEFWYSAHDVLGIGGEYNSSTFKEHASHYCAKPWDAAVLTNDQYPNADEHRLINQCIKSAWLYAVLHTGFGFPHDKPGFFESVQLIRGKEAHWSLGAIIYAMLNDKTFSLDNSALMELPQNKRTELAVSALLPVYPVPHIILDKNQDKNLPPAKLLYEGRPSISSNHDTSDLSTYYRHYYDLKARYSRLMSWTSYLMIGIALFIAYYVCATFYAKYRYYGTKLNSTYSNGGRTGGYYNGINLKLPSPSAANFLTGRDKLASKLANLIFSPAYLLKRIRIFTSNNNNSINNSKPNTAGYHTLNNQYGSEEDRPLTTTNNRNMSYLNDYHDNFELPGDNDEDVLFKSNNSKNVNNNISGGRRNISSKYIY